MLPWFQNRFPLYLAPMAGVTNTVFRKLCKEQGADVVVTEFVSAEGIFRRNERTLGFLEFDECERPLGVQLFGGDPEHLAEAARMVIDWKQPDFLDLNFGCPVNKVVSKNGGSSLLRDCPLLERVARAVARAAAPGAGHGEDPHRLGPQLHQCRHHRAHPGGRGHAGHRRAWPHQGTGLWRRGGLGDHRRSGPGRAGAGDREWRPDQRGRRHAAAARRAAWRASMLGRGAMSAPGFSGEIKEYAETGLEPAPVPLPEQWAFIERHCRLAVEHSGEEPHTMAAMRARLMAYSRGMPAAKQLREKFSGVCSLAGLREIAEEHLAAAGRNWH